MHGRADEVQHCTVACLFQRPATRTATVRDMLYMNDQKAYAPFVYSFMMRQRHTAASCCSYNECNCRLLLLLFVLLCLHALIMSEPKTWKAEAFRAATKRECPRAARQALVIPMI